MPCEVTGLGFDNGTEFLNQAAITLPAVDESASPSDRGLEEELPATIESKNSHLPRYVAGYEALV